MWPTLANPIRANPFLAKPFLCCVVLCCVCVVCCCVVLLLFCVVVVFCCIVCCCVLLCVVVCCWFAPSPPSAGPFRRTPPPPDRPPDRPKCRSLVPSPAPRVRSFSLSLGVFSWNFGGVFEDRGPQMCTRLRGRRGFTRQPENSKRAHFRAPALRTPPKFHEKTPREGRKNENCGERVKKRNFGPPTLRGPIFPGSPSSPRGCTFRAPPKCPLSSLPPPRIMIIIIIIIKIRLRLVNYNLFWLQRNWPR